MNIVPKVLPPLTLEQWLSRVIASTKLVLAPNTQSHDICTSISNEIALLIGPEGGLTETEINTANEYGFTNWCIGERVLRTETAPVVALAILNHLIQS